MGEVIEFRPNLKPAFARGEAAIIIILPVVRIERWDDDLQTEKPRVRRRQP